MARTRKYFTVAQQDAYDYLRKIVKRGATVYTVLHHVSRSGMERTIGAYVIRRGEIVNISPSVAKLLRWRQDHNRGGVKVAGCGMDMGFHLVYSLGSALFSKGRDTWGCENSSGGYAIDHHWM